MPTDSITNGPPDGEGMELSTGASTYKDDPYDKLYWWLLSIPLDPATLGILCRIITLSGINGRVWYARDELAKACRCSGRTLYAHLRLLKEHGLVRITERRAEGKTTVVELTSTVEIVQKQRQLRRKNPANYEGLKPIEHWLRSTVVPPEKSPRRGRQILPTPQADIAHPLGKICLTYNPHPLNLHPGNVGMDAADAAPTFSDQEDDQPASQEGTEPLDLPSEMLEIEPTQIAPPAMTETERKQLYDDACTILKTNPAAALTTQAFYLLWIRPRDAPELYGEWVGKFARQILPKRKDLAPADWWVLQRWTLTNTRRDPAERYDPLWLRKDITYWRKDGCQQEHWTARKAREAKMDSLTITNTHDRTITEDPRCVGCGERVGDQHNRDCTIGQPGSKVREEDSRERAS